MPSRVNTTIHSNGLIRRGHIHVAVTVDKNTDGRTDAVRTNIGKPRTKTHEKF